MSKKVRLCLATLEHDHAWWTLRHIVSEPNAELVGVLDVNPDRVLRFRSETQSEAPAFDSVSSMLESLSPDGLVITAPNSAHRSIAEAALTRGIHCLVQKPMATNLSDAIAMARTSERAGKILMVNHFPVWQPAVAEFFRLVTSGRIGTIRHLSTWNGHQGPIGINVLTEDYISWLYDKDVHGGGVLADQTNYGIAYSVWMLGRPLSVTATEVNVEQRAKGRLDDIAVVTLEYPNAVAQLQGSWGWPHRINEMRCIGSGGRVDLVNGELSLRAPTPSINDVPIPEILEVETVSSALAHGVAQFVHCIKTGESIPAPHTSSMNVTVTEVTEAALQASRERRTISFE